MQQDATTAGDEVSATLSYDGATASIASASSMEQDLTTTGIEMLASTTLGSDTIITSGDSITTATEIQTSPDSLPSSSEIISELPTTTTEPLAPDTSIATSSLSTTTTAGPNYTTIPVVSTFVSTGFTRFIRSMTFRKSDNMTFVTEVNGGFLYAITSLGAVSTLITGAANPINGPLNTARVVYPYGITVNINDDLVVSDRTHNIRAINQTDMYSLAGDLSKNPSISVNNPTGVAVDNSGNVYWTQDNGMIKKCDTNGIVTSFSGYSGSGYADGPASEAKFTLPKGIIFDSNNDVFYISSNHYISKMNMSGHVTMLAGNEVSGSTNAVGLAARFYTPAGLALDGRGNLIIADSLNNLVRSMDLATLNVTTIGGSVGIKNSRDGFGNQSLFAIPRDVALNQNGEILVLDYDNYAIRKITYTTFQI